ncbi:hypothetical protein FBEOM_9129 [Fusarium beomiforme]|uniref:Mid2 domain-containing protein n=1 Tax=Fusarium beomiforme TaxID=44412 RepID=A0A9P5ADW5_9HYPO|nr:hypothetical protein FBEOM_9129 [Fusarium beomiforme]
MLRHSSGFPLPFLPRFLPNFSSSLFTWYALLCTIVGVGRFNVLPSEPEVWATWNRKASQYDDVGTVFTDQSTTATASMTSAVTSSTTSTSITRTGDLSLPSSSFPGTSESSEAPAGLSTGAKAGIGDSIGVGAILAAAVVFLLWKMRRNKKAAKQEQQHPSVYNNPMADSSWQQSQYMYASKEPQHRPPQELSGTPMQGYYERAELPAHN